MGSLGGVEEEEEGSGLIEGLVQSVVVGAVLGLVAALLDEFMLRRLRK